MRFRRGRSSDPALPRLEPPNEAERDWIAEHVEAAHGVVRSLLSAETLTPEALDEAYAALVDDVSDTDQANTIVNMIGLAFGHVLVRDLGLEWAVATDEHGTEIAVHGQPGDFLMYPTNLVGKRFASREVHFLSPIYDGAREQLEVLRRS